MSELRLYLFAFACLVVARVIEILVVRMDVGTVIVTGAVVWGTHFCDCVRHNAKITTGEENESVRV